MPQKVQITTDGWVRPVLLAGNTLFPFRWLVPTSASLRAVQLRDFLSLVLQVATLSIDHHIHLFQVPTLLVNEPHRWLPDTQRWRRVVARHIACVSSTVISSDLLPSTGCAQGVYATYRQVRLNSTNFPGILTLEPRFDIVLFWLFVWEIPHLFSQTLQHRQLWGSTFLASSCRPIDKSRAAILPQRPLELNLFFNLTSTITSF